MATDPTRTPSQHSPQYSTEHHLHPTATKARLVWPVDKRSGPLSPYEEGSPHQLWGFFRTAPAWPWNIRVMADGTVEQREGMTQDEINEAEYVLWGGHEYWLDTSSDLYRSLFNAGYEFDGGVTPGPLPPSTQLVGFGLFPYGSPAGTAEGYGSPLPIITDTEGYGLVPYGSPIGQTETGYGSPIGD